MKKSIIIFGTTLAILSLLILGFTNWNNNETNVPTNNKDLVLENQDIIGPNLKAIPDLYYGVDSRFAAVKKSEIAKATSIYDFLNAGEKEQIVDIKSVNLTVIKDNQLSELHELGTTDQLTKEQIKLLRSLDFFNHFTIRTEFKGNNMITGVIEDKFFGPHITIVPEIQANYVEGKEALITYLKESSLDVMYAIKDDKINAVKFSFIITKEGKVTNVKHDAMTTGYPTIDDKFIELLKNIPGKWTPAENANGKKMEQELVFTFGPRDGC
ncbi:hypothetical protein [Winogradskyella thalassocola]|uniref:TonB protein C-terminal n=1 Tax=Winogradskyella thalassocola TaxID=262004 RepID=A0A1G8H852_9FLAO|nr:hypothetical protein [Winogradskyella thalassocola]SDI02854.1 hypothetical protein SAMN04489796_106158 [Winogradskyella thalassocola]